MLDGDAGTYCVRPSRCEPGTYVVAAESEDGLEHRCGLCAPGSFSAQENAPECLPWADCGPGEVVVAAGSATSDRMCAPCSDGSFSVAINGGACTPWTDCVAGFHAVEAGTSTQDRRCAPCPDGTFTTERNASECSAHRTCAPGWRVVRAGTATEEPRCEVCESGQHCPGEGQGYGCGVVDWDHDGDPATPCIVATDCAAGTYVTAAATSLADRQCAPCGVGRFSSEANAAACAFWTDCTLGERVLAEPTSAADRRCEMCPDGTFSGSQNAPVCEPWRNCGPGTYVERRATSGFDRRCAPCARRRFSDTENAAACTPWTQCGPDAVFSAFGSNTADVGCTSGWERQFGGEEGDFVTALAVDSVGNAYVGGLTTGRLEESDPNEEENGFLRKFSATAEVLWTLLLDGPDGTWGAWVTSVDVDDAGNAYVSFATPGDECPREGDFDTQMELLKVSPDGVVTERRAVIALDYDHAPSVVVRDESVFFLSQELISGRCDGSEREVALTLSSYSLELELNWAVRFHPWTSGPLVPTPGGFALLAPGDSWLLLVDADGDSRTVSTGLSRPLGIMAVDDGSFLFGYRDSIVRWSEAAGEMSRLSIPWRREGMTLIGDRIFAADSRRLGGLYVHVDVFGLDGALEDSFDAVLGGGGYEHVWYEEFGRVFMVERTDLWIGANVEVGMTGASLSWVDGFLARRALP